jgi:copper chaperone NosL
MLSRRQFLVLLGAAGAAAGGAALGVSALPGDNGDSRSGPPSIRYGEDACSTCGMVISDPRHAAAWRDAAGKAVRFDDIGCMITMFHQAGPGPGAAFYVHDYSDESWLEAHQATFVVAPSIKSPMAYGLAALSSHSAAERLAADHHGTVHDWDGAMEQAEHRGQK